MDADTISAAVTGFAAALILLFTWQHDRERKRAATQLDGPHKVTAIRPSGERRPPKKAAPLPR